jgi:hypothetical protein
MKIMNSIGRQYFSRENAKVAPEAGLAPRPLIAGNLRAPFQIPASPTSDFGQMMNSDINRANE